MDASTSAVIPDMFDSTAAPSSDNWTNDSTSDLAGLFPVQLFRINRPSIAVFDKAVTPIWYAVGFPGNLLAFLVWIQPRMRPSSGCYLAALAAGDFVFLVLHIIFELQSAWDVTLLNVPVLCELYPVLFLASQYLSPLLVLGFTVERYISVCHPFQRERYCNMRRTKCVIVSLILLSISLHLVQGYFWRYENGACDVRPEVTANDSRSLWSVWSWVTELLVFGVVPITILVLNILVIAETRRINANEDRLLGRSSTNATTRSSGPSATTMMLLAVSFYLILTTLPVTVCYAIYLSFPEGQLGLTAAEVANDARWQAYFNYNGVKIIVQEVCMSHYAGNIFIYLTTGKVFRSELRRMAERLTKATVCGCANSAADDYFISGSGNGSARNGDYRYQQTDVTEVSNHCKGMASSCL